MRDDLPSVTAIYVAFARALATRHPNLKLVCNDPCAESLLPSALVPLLHSPSASATIRACSMGLLDHVALRTGLIDSAVEHGIDDHSEGEHADRLQLVLLGAGLDARAHRLKKLARVRVFEVDHPATQPLKRRKARVLPSLARELRYVPCDFQVNRMSTALTQAGFDPGAPSIWVWEGVTMYLSEDAVGDTLTQISQLSARDSLLIATYLTPEVVTGGQLLGRWSERGLKVIAEGLRFTRTSEQIASLWSDAGFDVLSDAAPVDAAPHYGVEVQRPSSLMPKERIVVASRR